MWKCFTEIDLPRPSRDYVVLQNITKVGTDLSRPRPISMLAGVDPTSPMRENGIDGDEGVMKSDPYSLLSTSNENRGGRENQNTGLISSHPVSDMRWWRGLRNVSKRVMIAFE